VTTPTAKHILFIGIHTLRLNVTRGYGDHFPLTTTGPKEVVGECKIEGVPRLSTYEIFLMLRCIDDCGRVL